MFLTSMGMAELWGGMERRGKQLGQDAGPDIDQVFREYTPTLLRYLTSRVGSEAEARDLAQEAYLRLTRVSDSDLIRQPEAYVFRIAANLANEFLLKRRKAGHTVELEAVLETGGDGDSAAFEKQLEARSALRRLAAILEDLPPLYRAVLLLRRRDGLSHAEIARELSISPHTVHRYLTRALAACRAAWTE